MRGPVLVTGAAGFAGSHLIDLLAAEGADLVAWRRPGGAPPPSTPPGVRWMEVELLDGAAVERAVAGLAPAAVYHCAGAPHVARSWTEVATTYAVNVLATHRLLEALRRAAPGARVVVTGSATIYRPSPGVLTEDSPLGPTSPYATSKLAQELLARQAWQDDGQLVLISRSFNHIGPRQDPSFAAASFARQIAWIEAGRQAPVLAVGNLEAQRDVTDVRDTVRAYAAMMARGRPGTPYNVCSGHAVAIRELLEALLARARVSVQLVQDPARMRPDDVPLMLGSYARLEADTGWRPRHSLDETLDALLEYWRGQSSR